MYELIKKEFFNKEFLTSKSFIKMVCFTMVLIFAVVMGSVFGYVSADEGEDYSDCLYLTIPGYEASSCYNANNLYVNFVNPNQNGVLTSQAIFNHSWDFSGSETPSSFSTDNIKYYILTGSNYPSVYYLYMFDSEEQPYLCSDSSSSYFCLTYNPSDRWATRYYYVATLSPWGNGSTVTDPYIVFPDTCARYSMQNDVDFYNTMFFRFQTSTQILNTNIPLLTIQGSSYSGNYHNDYYNYINNSGNTNAVNINYQLEDDTVPGLDGFENLENIGSGGGSDETETSETSANNLYLNNAKWTFSIPKWSNLTGYSGNATFSSSLNDFQTDNLEDFYLRFQFRIDTTVSYVDSGEGGTSGGGHGTSVTGNNISTGYLQKTFSYNDSTTGNNYKDVQLQYFYNQGCSQSFMTLNGIFDRCMLQKLSLNNSSSSDTSFYNWYNDAVNSNTHTVTKAMLYCYATLYDSEGGSSGNCTYYYNLLTGESGVTDSSMSINSNPVVDEDGNIEYDPSDDIGSGTSINNNNSNSGVNVTQTVNVNNDSSDSKSWLWTLISSLLTSGSDDESISQAGMSDTLVNLVGINPWISLMSTAFGFVPATVWTSLSVAFIAVLGIMVVAFVLRVLLDLL